MAAMKLIEERPLAKGVEGLVEGLEEMEPLARRIPMAEEKSAQEKFAEYRVNFPPELFLSRCRTWP